MSMVGYRSNFGASEVGLKGHEKILIFGNGKGIINNKPLGFASYSPPGHFYNRESMTFELYDIILNKWSSIDTSNIKGIS